MGRKSAENLVAAIDQAAAPSLLQFEHDAIVGAEQFRRRLVAEPFDPMIVTISFSRTSKETPRSAVMLP